LIHGYEDGRFRDVPRPPISAASAACRKNQYVTCMHDGGCVFRRTKFDLKLALQHDDNIDHARREPIRIYRLALLGDPNNLEILVEWIIPTRP
jgi:hypothetical protein